MTKNSDVDDGDECDVSFLARPSENCSKVRVPLPSESALSIHRDTCANRHYHHHHGDLVGDLNLHQFSRLKLTSVIKI